MRTGRMVAGGVVLVPRLFIASSMFDRMRGLLGRDALPAGEGLLLSPCHAVHTWFMRFPIDVIFADREWTVLRVCRCIRPFRMVSGGWRALHTVEVQSGWLPQDALADGMRIQVAEQT